MADAQFLEVAGLHKTYSSGRGLHDITLTLPAGSLVSLGGPNGSGKSTLLRCLAGLATFRGRISLAGTALARSPQFRALIGYLPQVVAFPAEAAVGEVIELFARLRGCPPHTSLPPQFLPPWEERVGSLSEGQRHRVGLAVALLGHPRLLLLDEPLSSLDSDGRALFQALLRTLCDQEGITAIVSSPSSTELNDLADFVLLMESGRLSKLERNSSSQPSHMEVG